MLFHLSIDAEDPRAVAKALAELLGGKATPFAVVPGGWIASAGDARATSIEVYPRGTILQETPGDADAAGIMDETAGFGRGSATHFAMGTGLSADRVFEIAARNNWNAKYRKRGGLFGVIEMWVENERMVEVLTPVMQAEYRSARAPAGGDEDDRADVA